MDVLKDDQMLLKSAMRQRDETTYSELSECCKQNIFFDDSFDATLNHFINCTTHIDAFGLLGQQDAFLIFDCCLDLFQTEIKIVFVSLMRKNLRALSVELEIAVFVIKSTNFKADFFSCYGRLDCGWKDAC